MQIASQVQVHDSAFPEGTGPNGNNSAEKGGGGSKRLNTVASPLEKVSLCCPRSVINEIKPSSSREYSEMVTCTQNPYVAKRLLSGNLHWSCVQWGQNRSLWEYRETFRVFLSSLSGRTVRHMGCQIVSNPPQSSGIFRDVVGKTRSMTI
jgi:hypothetical protein